MATITTEYCSKYKSYNGKSVPKGYTLAPFLVPDEMLKYDDTLIRGNLRIWKIARTKLLVGFIAIPKADFGNTLKIFYNSIRSYFKDHPELNPGRCFLGMDKHGFPIICSQKSTCKNCDKCDQNNQRYKNREDYYMKNSKHLYSNDNSLLDHDYETPDLSSPPVEDMAIFNSLVSEITDYLKNYDKRYAEIFKLAFLGHTKKEIFQILNMTESTGYRYTHDTIQLIKNYLA